MKRPYTILSIRRHPVRIFAVASDRLYRQLHRSLRDDIIRGIRCVAAVNEGSRMDILCNMEFEMLDFAPKIESYPYTKYFFVPW